MLSNVSIENFLASRDLSIDPWKKEMLGSCRVTLHLGEKILIPDGKVVVDVKNNITPDYEEVKLTDSDPFKLEPGMFVVGETFETIGLSERVAMIVDGRSTFARLGISVVQTAILADSGQKPKKTTLEIKNSGPNPFLLYPRMRFCRAFFLELNPPATLRYDSEGRYQSGDSNKPIFRNDIKEDKDN